MSFLDRMKSQALYLLRALNCLLAMGYLLTLHPRALNLSKGCILLILHLRAMSPGTDCRQGEQNAH